MNKNKNKMLARATTNCVIKQIEILYHPSENKQTKPRL